ncbi:MAG: hypothetical protein M3O36_14835 [Myxococcota bacterium]|nr:hypothetical protein [Myxococcota bacterium]
MKNFCSKPAAPAAFALAVLSATPPAFADATSDRPLSERPVADRSIATQLFKEGRALLDQGRVAPACRKLEESQRLGPGGGTLLNLALCHEKEGRTATAWVEFTEALGIARRDDRQTRVEFARAHIAQLEPVLSRLSIQVPPAADMPDLEIRRDGSVVGRAAWGSPIPVDPGDHLIEAAAPAKMRWKQSVVVGANAESKVLVIPVLDDLPAQENAESAAPPLPATALAAGTEPELRGPVPAFERRERPLEGSSSTTVPAWIFMGLGVAGAGAGAYFGAVAVSQKRDADRNCPNDVCSAEGARQNNDAIRNANYATIAFGVGLAGLGLGAVLLATHSTSSSPATTPRARSHEGTLRLDGTRLSLDSLGPTGAKVMLSGRW